MTDPIRVLVTGSRHFEDYKRVERWLRWVERKAGPRGLVLVVGDADGADAIALDVCRRLLGCEVRKYDAEEYGKWPWCGPVRNQAMVDIERPHICLAFMVRGLKQKGTPDCLKRALNAGVFSKLIYQRRAWAA